MLFVVGDPLEAELKCIRYGKQQQHLARCAMCVTRPSGSVASSRWPHTNHNFLIDDLSTVVSDNCAWFSLISELID